LLNKICQLLTIFKFA